MARVERSAAAADGRRIDRHRRPRQAIAEHGPVGRLFPIGDFEEPAEAGDRVVVPVDRPRRGSRARRGQAVEAANVNVGKFRSTFEVNLAAPGTYKLALINNSLNAQYETASGERKRWRGTADTLSEIPADAKNVQITQQQGRNEAFVTAGKPNDTALKPTGVGLEMVPVTHPNDLVAGEPISFRFVLDGKPAANLEVEVVPGGTRYRNNQNETKYTTDKDGLVTMTWNDAGMYWLEASVQDNNTSVKQAKSRRASYVATFEVLPP